MRDEILKLADELEKRTDNLLVTRYNHVIAAHLRRIVAREDARLRVAQTDARCACDGEPDGE